MVQATQPTEIPQELIDEVLANLHGNKEALRTTSLAARSFRQSSQAILFREVKIKNLKQARTLSGIVKNSEHLSSLIQTFVIAEPTLKWMKKDSQSRLRLSSEEVEEVQRELAQILDCLSNIKTLDVDGGGFATDWPQLLPVFKDALTKIFASPTLKDVLLSGFYEIPPSIFHCFRPLRRLELGHIAIYGEGITQGQIEAVGDYLNVNRVQMDMGILFGSYGTDGYFLAKTEYILPTVFHALKPKSVTELCLKYKWGVPKLQPTNFGMKLAQCDLKPFSNLASLSFSWQILSPSGVNHFSTVVQTISPDTPLEHLTLDFGCVTREVFETDGRNNFSLGDIFEDLDWFDADAYIASLKNLDRFEVKITLHQLEQFSEVAEDSPALEAITVSHISKVFSSVASVKKLRIECIIEEDPVRPDTEELLQQYIDNM